MGVVFDVNCEVVRGEQCCPLWRRCTLLNEALNVVDLKGHFGVTSWHRLGFVCRLRNGRGHNRE